MDSAGQETIKAMIAPFGSGVVPSQGPKSSRDQNLGHSGLLMSGMTGVVPKLRKNGSEVSGPGDAGPGWRGLGSPSLF